MNTELLKIIIGLIVSVTGMILLARIWKVHAFLSLLLASLTYGFINGKSLAAILQSIQAGFGTLVSHIGLLVVLGSILGMLLEKSGGMEAISTNLLRVFGKRNSVAAITVIGAIVGIPVFCDSGFIILSRLIPSIAVKAAVNPASLSLGLASGLYTTHTLVPPTPGPLAAAANLGAADHIGFVMLLGIAASVPVTIVSFLLAKKFGRKISSSLVDVEIPSQKNRATWKAFLPLLLPIVLIALASIPEVTGSENIFFNIVEVAGIPVIALSIGVIIALPMIPRENKAQMPSWMGEAIKDAGSILLIVGAGGAFGAVIKSTNVDVVLKSYVSDSPTQGVAFLILAFMLATILKTAQGSTTSAMIISSSLLVPLAINAGLTSPVEITALVIAIGGGAMTVSHVNDAYFWVVSQFGKIGSSDMLRTYTILSLCQGLTALIVSIILLLLV